MSTADRLEDLQAEQAVLGAMLIDGGCISAVAQRLREEDFVLPEDRTIFRTLAAMDREGRPVDGLTAADALGASGELTLPMAAAINKELTLKGLRRYRHCYPMAIQAVSTGRIDLKRIVTNEFTFDQLPQALDTCIQDKAHVVKGVIKIAD